MKTISVKVKDSKSEDNKYKMVTICNFSSTASDVYELNRIMHALSLYSIQIEDNNNKFTYKLPFKL